MQELAHTVPDGVSLCSNAMIFDVSSHRIAATGFDGIQNGSIDKMEISTNLPASSMLFYIEIFLVIVCLFIVRHAVLLFPWDTLH